MNPAGRGIFVTGTDTGVGKTQVTLGVMLCLQRYGLRVAGMKPIASGCYRTEGGLRNADALSIQQQCSLSLPYKDINPFALELPIAPELAAREAGIAIEMAAAAQAYHRILRGVDWCIVEGVGGWLVPISARHTVADLVQYLALPVVLVVGIRLGCVNHTLLSVESIQQRGLSLLGWVANQIDADMVRPEANIASLQERIEAPLIGIIPFTPVSSATAFAAHLHAGLAALIRKN
jgi:dethiobiotin synthetase